MTIPAAKASFSRAMMVSSAALLSCLYYASSALAAEDGSVGAPNGPSLVSSLLAQGRVNTPARGTILPTDITGPAINQPMTFGSGIRIKALQYLPAKLFINTSVETSLRYESNPFQAPNKRVFLRKFVIPGQFQQLNSEQQQQITRTVNTANQNNAVLRVLPNITAGWALTPKSRVYGNYFLIRDSLSRSTSLNTTVQSVSYGAQHDFRIAPRALLLADMQFRELFQTNQQPQFDFLPSMTLSYYARPSMILYVNTLLQIRGKKYFQAPTKELDPFYTVGMTYLRNGWQFSAITTFLQNFREPYGRNAIIRQDNYSIISDFEIARSLFKKSPGIQAFVRAEPIWNMHSKNTIGLAGFDMRLFGGFRVTLAKAALTTAMDQIREDLEEEPAPSPKTPAKPSASVERPLDVAHQPHDGRPVTPSCGWKPLPSD